MTTSAATTRLPGVSFETPIRTPERTLPRMDIAAFVGFATGGPLHVPVPVEDVTHFRELFGDDDLALAWDPARGRFARSLLGPSVEAFFGNGGVRCWVVRVGEASGDVGLRHEFVVPGLALAGDFQGSPVDVAPVTAPARSVGTWCDDVQIATILRSEAATGDDAVLSLSSGAERLLCSALWVDVSAGELIELRFDGGFVHMFFVGAVEATLAGTAVTRAFGQWFRRTSGSPSGTVASPELVPISEADAIQNLGASAGVRSAWRLRFDLLSRQGTRRRVVADLAFDPQHPRYWGQLPTDEQLFRNDEGRAPQAEPGSPLEAIWEEARTPRFALAGPAGAERYLPYDMAFVEAWTDGPVETFDDVREANGIALLGHELFLDERLKDLSVASLLSEAEYRRYVRDEDLPGIYGLLPIGEVTMVAVPDAVHFAELADVSDTIAPLVAPELHPPAETTPCCVAVRWDAVSDATGYVLSWSHAADFESATTQTTAADRLDELVEVACDCPAPVYLRVRALRYDERGPWSMTHVLVVPHDAFFACDETPPGRLEIELSMTPGFPGFLLEWTSDAPAGAVYRVEWAADVDFLTAVESDARTTTEVEAKFDELEGSDRWFRVRVEPDGPWSNSLLVAAEPPRVAELGDLFPLRNGHPNTGAGEVIAVHRALLRFCAARADLVAILGLPRPYRANDALEHVAALRPPSTPSSLAEEHDPGAAVPPLTFGERRALSYGAVYHPWTVVATSSDLSTDGLLWAPPTGAIAGTWASLTLERIERGAWWAPANRPLADVLGLGLRVSVDERLRLSNGSINVLIEDPRGHMVLDAKTLSGETEWHLINVRRLMILLRRLALQEGATFVFDPHDDGLQSLVRHRFERFLSEMYQRGAFAGATPADAFRVVTDETVNPPASVDAGRFVVELRVAPSRPLAFLRVRLVQSGPGKLTLEEIA